MLTNLNVNGFRSLVNFHIQFQPGLNVLVGSNGTGKSNLIAFLDFMSVFIERDLNHAIGVAQGAGSVFSHEEFSDEEASLTFEASGNWAKDDDADSIYSRRGDKSTAGSYEYSATIKYLRSVPAVFISNEYIDIQTNASTPIRIRRETLRKDQEFVSSVEFLTPEEELSKELRFLHRDDGDLNLSAAIEKIMSPDTSIWGILMGATTGLTYAFFDLMSYRSVNIDPTLARLPTPVGLSSQLEPTGKGLAGSLYEIKRGRYISGARRHMRAWLRQREEQPHFDSIVSWCKEVNPSIEHVDVSLDFAEAQLRASMEFRFGDKNHTFSFARISDGTVKWLALVTILLAEPSLNIIEEPENFLHPFMQESFISLCRQVLENNPTRVIVLSTHSPTLLDSCDPRELTMFELENGQTRATRIENANELAEKIRRSRFGLGHYYKTGAVYGEGRSTG